MSITSKRSRLIEMSVHALAWAYIFISPLFLHRPEGGMDAVRLAHSWLLACILCFVFYVNFFWLVPKYLLRKQNLFFYGVNGLLLLTMAVFFECTILTQFFGFFSDSLLSDGRKAFPRSFQLAFFVRNLVTFIFAWGAAIAVCLAIRWRESQRALSESELGRTEAELANLKAQISPHFLLNTLNNIYSLTAFDIEKAQVAILELSRMLRYQLYESSDRWVSLEREVDFLNNYIALMRLRLTDNVVVETDFAQAESSSLGVAPHLFISLVENAFKHGVSPVQKSYIRIALRVEGENIVFSCRNSNHPKPRTDKSPGGIGLSLVERRLHLSYPDAHTWNYGVNDEGTEYHAELKLPALSL